MQEVFENIIEKLEEYRDKNLVEHDSEMANHCKQDCDDVNDCTLCVFDKAIEIVKQIAAEYNNGWISCSERLPSDCENHEVTARLSNGKICMEFAYYGKARGEWWNFDDDGLVNVIAWKEGSQLYQPNGE